MKTLQRNTSKSSVFSVIHYLWTRSRIRCFHYRIPALAGSQLHLTLCMYPHICCMNIYTYQGLQCEICNHGNLSFWRNIVSKRPFLDCCMHKTYRNERKNIAISNYSRQKENTQHERGKTRRLFLRACRTTTRCVLQARNLSQ